MFHVKRWVLGSLQPQPPATRPFRMHGWVWWIIVGFVAGALAKAFMPGSNREPKGCLFTIFLGVAGSLVTGFLMRALLHDEGMGGLIPTIVGATLGAMLLIMIFRKWWK